MLVWLLCRETLDEAMTTGLFGCVFVRNRSALRHRNRGRCSADKPAAVRMHAIRVTEPFFHSVKERFSIVVTRTFLRFDAMSTETHKTEQEATEKPAAMAPMQRHTPEQIKAFRANIKAVDDEMDRLLDRQQNDQRQEKT